jgi:hypothetical protein
VAHNPVTYEASETVARKSNLILRNGRWYYNRAYPKDLWPVVGKAPFRLALGTDSLEEAQRQRGMAEQRYWAAVDAGRQKLDDSRPRSLTDNEAVGIVSRWFAQRNRELEEGHLTSRRQLKAGRMRWLGTSTQCPTPLGGWA